MSLWRNASGEDRDGGRAPSGGRPGRDLVDDLLGDPGPSSDAAPPAVPSPGVPPPNLVPPPPPRPPVTQPGLSQSGQSQSGQSQSGQSQSDRSQPGAAIAAAGPYGPATGGREPVPPRAPDSWDDVLAGHGAPPARPPGPDQAASPPPWAQSPRPGAAGANGAPGQSPADTSQPRPSGDQAGSSGDQAGSSADGEVGVSGGPRDGVSGGRDGVSGGRDGMSGGPRDGASGEPRDSASGEPRARHAAPGTADTSADRDPADQGSAGGGVIGAGAGATAPRSEPGERDKPAGVESVAGERPEPGDAPGSSRPASPFPRQPWQTAADRDDSDDVPETAGTASAAAEPPSATKPAPDPPGPAPWDQWGPGPALPAGPVGGTPTSPPSGPQPVPPWATGPQPPVAPARPASGQRPAPPWHTGEQPAFTARGGQPGQPPLGWPADQDPPRAAPQVPTGWPPGPPQPGPSQPGPSQQGPPQQGPPQQGPPPGWVPPPQLGYGPGAPQFGPQPGPGVTYPPGLERQPHQAPQPHHPQHGWDQARPQVSVADLTPQSLLKQRRRPPQTGWRKAVYLVSAHSVNPGESPADVRRRELIERATLPVQGCYRIAVISLKGGVGKTTAGVCLGATLASLRGDRVIAVDANPDRGTLSGKIPLETAATVRNLLNDADRIQRYSDVRRYTSQSADRLEVLASETDPAVSIAFSENDYRTVATILERFYNVVITDCGTGLLHSAMSGVLALAHQIIVVSSGSVDGARSASATIDWLEAHGYGDLVRGSVAVINSVRSKSGGVDLDRLHDHFAARCRAVTRIPYDPHLEEGAEVDLAELKGDTRYALLELAAAVADGFPRVGVPVSAQH